MTVEPGADRGCVLLIHGLWFRAGVWTPWLRELSDAGYDATVLGWRDRDQRPHPARAGEPDFGAVLRAARRAALAFRSPPIVIGHGVGGAVAERLLSESAAAAAISLAPPPGGRPAVPAAARQLGRRTGFALLGLRAAPVAPTFAQFRRGIATLGGDADARRLYDDYVGPAAPRPVLLPALRRRAGVRPGRGPLLLAAGGKDDLVSERSTALLHRDYRRRQPDAVTDYQVFPGLDHTLGLGTPSVTVLFYCLDWLTAQNM